MAIDDACSILSNRNVENAFFLQNSVNIWGFKMSASKKEPKAQNVPVKVSPNWQKLKNQIEIQNSNPANKKKRNGRSKRQKIGSIENDHISDTSAASQTPTDIWFDDVDPCLIKSSILSSSTNESDKKLCKEKSFNGLTKCVAIDCEMVGTGFYGLNSILARVSIVNLYGHCVYDKFIKPTEEVTDYRTEVSGVRPQDLADGEDFKVAQKEVFNIINNRILVGHSVHNDLKVLYLSHPRNKIRDTSRYFRQFFNNRTPSLKKLCTNYLGVTIQEGEHNSVTDAQATMRLYTLFKKKWESTIVHYRKAKKNQQTTIVSQELQVN